MAQRVLGVATLLGGLFLFGHYGHTPFAVATSADHLLTFLGVVLVGAGFATLARNKRTKQTQTTR